jgi:hypothetical protein
MIRLVPLSCRTGSGDLLFNLKSVPKYYGRSNQSEQRNILAEDMGCVLFHH